MSSAVLRPASWISPLSFDKFRISCIMNQNPHFNELSRWFTYTIQSIHTDKACLLILCVHTLTSHLPTVDSKLFDGKYVCHIYLWFLTLHKKKGIWLLLRMNELMDYESLINIPLGLQAALFSLSLHSFYYLSLPKAWFSIFWIIH